jgi:hypothetical protein
VNRRYKITLVSDVVSKNVLVGDQLKYLVLTRAILMVEGNMVGWAEGGGRPAIACSIEL